ncbi:MAG: hypothetical protein ACUZ8E_02935 [Candidatus Anammoxibacter sp.]
MIESNRRYSPRFKYDTKVDIDMLNINENDSQCMENVFEAKVVDIGVQGVMAEFTPDMKERITDNILKGAKKVRLIFSVDSSSKVVNTFAIPVWNTSDCKYCDITEDSFLKISDLVDKLKIINENNDSNYLLNDGNLLNLNIIKKPDLCKKCINDGNRTKKEACNLARFKQIDAIEFICSSFKPVKKRKFNSLRDIILRCIRVKPNLLTNTSSTRNQASD